MNLQAIMNLDEQYYMNTFGKRTPVAFTRGEGIHLYDTEGVVAVRYPKGSDTGVFTTFDPSCDYEFINRGKGTLAVSYGRVFNELFKANADVTMLKLNKIYPFSDELLKEIKEYKNVFFFEEVEENGSVSEHLLNALNRSGFDGKFKAVTLPNGFFKQGKIPKILAEYKLDADGIKEILREEC